MKNEMSSDFKCFIGFHKYEIYKEIPITSKTEIELGKLIVSKCNNCGKIHQDYIDLRRI